MASRRKLAGKSSKELPARGSRARSSERKEGSPRTDAPAGRSELSDSLLADLPGYVYRVANDADYTPEFISEGVTAVTGYAVEEYLVTRVISCGKEIVPEDAARVWDEVQKALEAKRPYELEYRIRTKSGKVRWVWERGRGVWSSAGALRHLQGFVTDITDRVLAAEMARAQEQRYERLLESAPDATLVSDQNGRLIRANAEALNLFGYTRDEMLALNVQDLVPERYRDAHVQHMAGFLARPRTRMMGGGPELWALRKDGAEFPCEIGLNCDRDDGGLVTLVSIRDVTERRRAEQARVAIEAGLAAAQAQAKLGSWELDVATGAVTCSAEMYRLCERDPALGPPTLAGFLDQVHPDDRDRFVRVHALAAQGQASGSIEFRFVLPGGRVRWFEARGGLRSSEGHPSPRLAGTTQDITERKVAEIELADARRRLQRVVASGKVGLWDWDLSTNHVEFSSEWKRQIGYDEHEIRNEFDEWRSRLHPDDLDGALQRVQDYLNRDEPDYESRFRLRHKDGSYRHILARGSEVRGEDGQRIRLLGSHVDITEISELQAQFQQAQKMDLVGQLAGGVAHDFNNILTVINGTAEMALAGVREGDPLRDDLEEIRRAGERAAALTRQLLAFSRQQIMKTDVLDLNDVLAGMQDMLRRLIGEHIDLLVLGGEGLGSVRVDRGQLEQVVLNVAVNARDAMPDGGKLTIETRNVELDEAFTVSHASVVPGPHVMLAISDTGHGMDRATMARIFEPFFTTKETGRGTGLGLSTVYGIVKQSGGSIWVYSEVGQGTTFKIYLPRVADVSPRPQPEQSAGRAVEGAETILLVEDEDTVRGLASRFLQAAGYTVLTAANAGEALLIAERHPGEVDLLLTDVVMPGMNGRELATRLADVRPSMDVLYASGYTDDAILRHGVLDEVTHFIGKPYSKGELTRKVRELLDARRG